MSDFLSFHLSDSFIAEYENKPVEWGFDIGGGNSLSELTFLSKYSRKKADGTKEKWFEVCRRCIEGMYSILKDHCAHQRTPWNEFKAQKAAQDAFDRMFNFKWTPPGRGMWSMGTEYVHLNQSNSSLNNCFSGDSTFITAEYGVTRFDEVVGEEVTVLTQDGWESGLVSSFGVQDLNEVTFKPWSNSSKTIRHKIKVTPNHRWLLNNGEWVTELNVGDKISGFVAGENNLSKIDENDNYWDGLLHGVVFGDGTKHPHIYANGDLRFQLRACDSRVEQAMLHPEMKSRVNTSFQRYGDWNFSIRSKINLKEYPTNVNPSYLKGFIEGWIVADAYASPSKREAYVIASSRPDALAWLNDFAALAGFTVTGANIDPVMETNFGLRKNPSVRITLTRGSVPWEVESISTNNSEEVYCVTVPTAGSFTLSSGIYTGNCAFVSTEKLSNHSAYEATMPFSRLMEMSMNGVGVGFDTKGAGKLTIWEPVGEPVVWTVPDTREGWAESVAVQLESYFFKNRQPVEFDYSEIRPAGAPLKSFGGTASGPGPLSDVHESIAKQFAGRNGEKITSRDIVDIMNKLGKAVVAGGARRSALIALGDAEDDDYVNIKNWELPENAERTGPDGWAWTSNNSVLVNSGDSLDHLVDKIAINGEPGVIWLDMMRRFGRMADPENNRDYRVSGCNPCFSGDTLIATADGRGAVSIGELAESGDDVPVYSLNVETGEVEVKMARNPRMTRSSVNLVEVTFSDGSSLKVTPDHKIVLLDGTIKQAGDLVRGDRLPAFNKRLMEVKRGGNKYIQVHTDVNDSNQKTFEHRLIAKFHNLERWNELYDNSKKSGWIKGGIVVHHKDYNPLNNSPNNLEIMTHSDHAKLHGDVDNSGNKNPMYGRKHSDATKAVIGKKCRDRFRDPEYKQSVIHAIRDGIDDEARQKISESRKKSWLQYYIEQEASTDLKTIWIKDKLYAVKSCKTCSGEMILSWRQRHAVFCSRSCSNADAEVTAAQVRGLRSAHNNRSAETLSKQVDIYLSLQVDLGRDPKMKEWEEACKEEGIPFRMQKNTENPNILKNFADLKERASLVNHRVVDVCKVEGEHDVFNLTVDDNNTIAIATKVDGPIVSGILTFQCAEISLESNEFCCLVELYPSRHESFADFKKSIKHAYMYAKAVTLMPSTWAETNEVITRNRRIGVSMTGIVDFIEANSWSEMQYWMDEGYGYLSAIDTKYSEWLGVRNSVKLTTVKPAGTTSIIAGTTSGVHWPTTSGYYIRRIRFHKTDPILPILKKAGYDVEDDVMDSKSTAVASFPTKGLKVRSERDVSIWEKASLAAMAQRYWADNMVSVTVSFREDEQNEISPLLRSLQGQVKSLSFLPISDSGTTYAQAPYEPISEEDALKMMKKIKPLDLKALYEKAEEGEGEKFCTTDVCEVTF